MKHKFLFTTALFLFIFQSTFAQFNFYKKAYLVTVSGDTINGYINKKRNSQLINTILFRNTLNDSSTTINYTPSQIKSFYFPEDNIKFESVLYTSDNHYNIREYKFASVIFHGNISLYRIDMLDKGNTQIFEHENNHIYVIKQDTSYTVLRVKEETIEEKYYLNKDYIIQLQKISSKWPSVKGDVSRVGFNDQEITSFLLNNTDTSKLLEKKTTLFNNGTKREVKHGLNFAFTNSGNQTLMNKQAFSVGYFWDVHQSYYNKRISIMFGIEYFKTDTSSYKEGYLYSSFRLPILARLKLSKGKIQPFINAGLTPYFVDFLKIYTFSDNFGIGAYFNDRLLLNILSEYCPAYYNSKIFYNFKLGYVLHKNKH